MYKNIVINALILIYFLQIVESEKKEIFLG